MPKIGPGPSFIPIPYGSNAILSCVAQSPVAYTVFWYKDGADITYLKQADNSITLTNFQQKDVGIYRCIVQNQYGQVQHEVNVTANGGSKTYRIILFSELFTKTLFSRFVVRMIHHSVRYFLVDNSERQSISASLHHPRVLEGRRPKQRQTSVLCKRRTQHHLVQGRWKTAEWKVGDIVNLLEECNGNVFYLRLQESFRRLIVRIYFLL